MRTSPGTVGGGDCRGTLHSGDERWLQIKQVTVQIGHAGRGGDTERDGTDEGLGANNAVILNQDGRERAGKGEGVYLLADSEEGNSSGV